MVSYLAESNYAEYHGTIRNSCCFENNVNVNELELTTLKIMGPLECVHLYPGTSS